MAEVTNRNNAPVQGQRAQGAPRPANVRRKKKTRLNYKRIAIVAAVPIVIICAVIALVNGKSDIKKQVKGYIQQSSGFSSSAVKIVSDGKPTKARMKELFGDQLKVKGVYLVQGKYGKYSAGETAPETPVKGDYFLVVCVKYKKDSAESYELKNVGTYKTKDEMTAAAAEYVKTIDSSLTSAA